MEEKDKELLEKSLRGMKLGFSGSQVEWIEDFIDNLINKALEIEAGDSHTLYEMMKKKHKQELDRAREEGIAIGFETYRRQVEDLYKAFKKSKLKEQE